MITFLSYFFPTFLPSFFLSFFHSSVCPLVCLSLHLFIHSFIHSFIHCHCFSSDSFWMSIFLFLSFFTFSSFLFLLLRFFFLCLFFFLCSFLFFLFVCFLIICLFSILSQVLWLEQQTLKSYQLYSNLNVQFDDPSIGLQWYIVSYRSHKSLKQCLMISFQRGCFKTIIFKVKTNGKNLQWRVDHALVIIKSSMRIKISIQRIVEGPR